MTIGPGDLVEISLRYFWAGQTCMNVFQYEVGNYAGSPGAAPLGEAWWNHVKATYRAMSPTSFTNTFDAVLVRELNDPAGEYAEYPIPTGERVGTRSTAGLTDVEPSFVAAGVRLTVGSRVTRPGQKRLAFLFQEDVLNQLVIAPMLTLIQSWAAIIDGPMTLGAPAALTELIPIVTRKDASGAVVAWQEVTGSIVSSAVTSQISRKQGRGQ